MWTTARETVNYFLTSNRMFTTITVNTTPADDLALMHVTELNPHIMYHQISNEFVGHSDVVGASPVGAAPTTYSFLTYIGRSPRQGLRHHAFMLHCTILPQPLAQQGVRLQRVRSLVAFNVTLLILVLEIPFNFQFDMQCAWNVNSNVSFHVNACFEQILFPWHTWARSKGLRTIGS